MRPWCSSEFVRCSQMLDAQKGSPMRTLDELVDEYDRDHRHPLNRALHLVGITLIGSSVVLLVIAPGAGALLFVSGWAAQLVGHRVEGKKPSFTRDLRFMAAGAVWYRRQMT